MCGGFTCSKNALTALNIMYIIVSFILIGVAAYGRVSSIVTNITIFGAVIACGVFLLLLSLVGLIGAVKHHQVLLFFYMVILFLLFVVQFSVACACLAMTEDQERELASQGWKKASPAVRAQAERIFRCCGFERNASDPTAEPQCEHVPTCCPPQEIPPDGTCECQGCWSALHQAIRNGLKITGGIGMFFSFTELVAVFVAYRYRLQKDPEVDPYLLLGGGARVT
ncbi:tetraspanin-13 isoform X1 [Rhipicephalus sanguineus]|uniref:tetraspanin-13 isoform X1 n=1 Tax=Rhipicephalus sanguineus TaxID=34632 RepID=UPI00189379D3|nr:tetraspanin-13 isoform X1 [Rhipicephalus sanguineus]